MAAPTDCRMSAYGLSCSAPRHGVFSSITDTIPQDGDRLLLRLQVYKNNSVIWPPGRLSNIPSESLDAKFIPAFKVRLSQPVWARSAVPSEEKALAYVRGAQHNPAECRVDYFQGGKVFVYNQFESWSCLVDGSELGELAAHLVWMWSTTTTGKMTEGLKLMLQTNGSASNAFEATASHPTPQPSPILPAASLLIQ